MDRSKGDHINITAEQIRLNIKREIQRQDNNSNLAEGEQSLETTPISFGMPLLSYEDETFVDNAYRLILGREPDSPGRESYLNKLRNSILCKEEVICALRFSREGRLKKSKIEGFLRALIITVIWRIPVISTLVKTAIFIITGPGYKQEFLQKQKALEAKCENIQSQYQRQFEKLEKCFIEDYGKLEQQVLTNQTVTRESLEKLEQQFSANQTVTRESLEKFEQQFSANQTVTRESLEKLEQQVSANQTVTWESFEKFEQQFSENRELLEKNIEQVKKQLTERLDFFDSQLCFVKRSLLTKPEGKNSQLTQGFNVKEIIGDWRVEREGLINSLYLAFEDTYRGSENLVSERLSVYLPHIERCLTRDTSISALDLGCGRGEWLQLLKNLGILGIGLDCNPLAVAHCQDKGINAKFGEANACLQEIDDDSLDLITAFHLIEHLSVDNFYGLLIEIVRVLKPGGQVFLETPNPANILVSSYDFYRDPSHQQPVHPDTLRFLLHSFGCSEVKTYGVLHDQDGGGPQLLDTTLAPLDTIDDYVSAPRDYCLLATK